MGSIKRHTRSSKNFVTSEAIGLFPALGTRPKGLV